MILVIESVLTLMQEVISLCGNRYVLFDNKTKDENKRLKQVQQLLTNVDMVISNNGGQPYRDDLFIELKVKCFANFTISFV
jgi:hypothetical protein